MEAAYPAGERPHKLNDIQVSLLRIFNRGMTDQETTEVSRLLMSYYDVKLQEELERVIMDKGYDQSDYDAMLNQQDRTAFNQLMKYGQDEGGR
jgi:hypothetical protein